MTGRPVDPAGKRRSRGRPRKPETDRAILAATRELLVEDGYNNLAIEAVARRAGVGKPAVYRRHESKAALVSAALLEILQEVSPAAPDTGDVVEDLRILLGNLVEALNSTLFGPAMMEILSPSARDRNLGRLFDEATAERRKLSRLLFERAATQGRLRVDSVEDAIDMSIGAIYFRHLVIRQKPDQALVDSVIDALVGPAVENTDG